MKNMAIIGKIENKIFQIRGKRVMIDVDLAQLYQVPTKVLNQAVRRHIGRFPEDFMFKLTESEKQEVVTICDHLQHLKFSHHLPHAFTEQGVAMLSSVLNSELAISVNIQIMRAFVNVRRVAMTYASLRRKIDEMERKYDGQFAVVFQAIKRLLTPSLGNQRRITGFKPEQ